MKKADLPVAIIGGGPIGLAAAARMHGYGLDFVLLEAQSPGGAISEWGHVRLFSPWARNVDQACVRLLNSAADWAPPDGGYIPKGFDLISNYLVPLANTPALRNSIVFGARAKSITRLNVDRSWVDRRSELPFEIRYEKERATHVVQARAVIDATGLMETPKPIGSNGLPIPGEREHGHLFTYGVPKPDDIETMGERVLVIGAGHTAMQCIVGLARSGGSRKEIDWAIRQASVDPLLRVTGSDRFPARLALQAKARSALTGGQTTLIADSRFERATATKTGIRMTWLTGEQREYDRVVVAAGYKPNYQMTGELQTAFDPTHECPAGMKSVIDAARGACAAVPLHGEPELRQPEPGFYIAGMRSFGRASSFFLLAGYEQIRSIAAKIAGDAEAVAPRPYMNMEEMTLAVFLAQNPYYLDEAFA